MMGRILRLVTVLSRSEYLAEFITEKKIQGCQKTTLKDHKKFINDFFRFNVVNYKIGT